MHISILNSLIFVCTDCIANYTKIKNFFYKHIKNNINRSADMILIIEETLSEDRFKYLHRNQYENNIQSLGIKYLIDSSEWSDWLDTAPPLIPYNLKENINQFVALHAAAIKKSNDKAIIVMGNREAGKSTLSLGLCKKNNWELYTDETTIIRTTDQKIIPLLRQVHIYKKRRDMLKKEYLSFTDAAWLKTAEKPCTPDIIIELVHIHGLITPYVTTIPDVSSKLKLILPHTVKFGTSNSDVLKTIFKPAVNCSFYQVCHGGFRHFKKLENIISELA